MSPPSTTRPSALPIASDPPATSTVAVKSRNVRISDAWQMPLAAKRRICAAQVAATAVPPSLMRTTQRPSKIREENSSRSSSFAYSLATRGYLQSLAHYVEDFETSKQT